MKNCYKAGLIRVITISDAEVAGIHGRLMVEKFPNTAGGNEMHLGISGGIYTA